MSKETAPEPKSYYDAGQYHFKVEKNKSGHYWIVLGMPQVPYHKKLSDVVVDLAHLLGVPALSIHLHIQP